MSLPGWGTRATWTDDDGSPRFGVVWGKPTKAGHVRLMVPSGPPGYARFTEVPRERVTLREESRK